MTVKLRDYVEHMLDEIDVLEPLEARITLKISDWFGVIGRQYIQKMTGDNFLRIARFCNCKVEEVRCVHRLVVGKDGEELSFTITIYGIDRLAVRSTNERKSQGDL